MTSSKILTHLSIFDQIECNKLSGDTLVSTNSQDINVKMFAAFFCNLQNQITEHLKYF